MTDRRLINSTFSSQQPTIISRWCGEIIARQLSTAEHAAEVHEQFLHKINQSINQSKNYHIQKVTSSLQETRT